MGEKKGQKLSLRNTSLLSPISSDQSLVIQFYRGESTRYDSAGIRSLVLSVYTVEFNCLAGGKKRLNHIIMSALLLSHWSAEESLLPS